MQPQTVIAEDLLDLNLSFIEIRDIIKTSTFFRPI